MRHRLILKCSITVLALVLTILIGSSATVAQTSSFTYQGRLTDGGTAANGNYDLQFALFDSLSGGSQVGSTQTLNAVAVSNGVFTVSLDFAANAFPGASRFLEISARPSGSGSFTLLSPRQPITSSPYAVRSSSAANADTATNATNASQLGGVAASQYVQTNDSRLSDPRPPTPGSSNYIQNTGSSQTANFNISGNGIVGGNVGIGTTTPVSKLDVNGNLRISNAALSKAGRIGVDSTGLFLEPGETNSSIRLNANPGLIGLYVKGTDGNVGVGTTAPDNRLTVSQSTPNNFAGHFFTSGVPTGQSFGLVVSAGTDFRDLAFQVRNQAGQGLLKIDGSGRLFVKDPGLAGAFQLCYAFASDGTGDYLEVLRCSSSLRYKSAIKPFLGGLDIINRLRPISFTWKRDGTKDIGLGAEDVEKVAPLLTFRNSQGEIEGVKYNQLSAVFINAFKEQQAQIQKQQAEAKQQQALINQARKQIAALKLANGAISARLRAIERALRNRSSAARRR